MATPLVIVRLSLLALVLTIVCARYGSAQTVESFAELPQVLKRGTTVFVQDEKGERTKGTITELSPSSIELKTPGVPGGLSTSTVPGRTVTFAADRVTRVSRVDSRLNGFWIGALIGVGAGIYSGVVAQEVCDIDGSNCLYAYPLFGGLFGLIGGGIGFGIDGAIDGQTPVFARGGVASPLQARLAPFTARHPTGLRLSIRF